MPKFVNRLSGVTVEVDEATAATLDEAIYEKAAEAKKSDEQKPAARRTSK